MIHLFSDVTLIRTRCYHDYSGLAVGRRYFIICLSHLAYRVYRRSHDVCRQKPMKHDKMAKDVLVTRINVPIKQSPNKYRKNVLGIIVVDVFVVVVVVVNLGIHQSNQMTDWQLNERLVRVPSAWLLLRLFKVDSPYTVF